MKQNQGERHMDEDEHSADDQYIVDNVDVSTLRNNSWENQDTLKSAHASLRKEHRA